MISECLFEEFCPVKLFSISSHLQIDWVPVVEFTTLNLLYLVMPKDYV